MIMGEREHATWKGVKGYPTLKITGEVPFELDQDKARRSFTLKEESHTK